MQFQLVGKVVGDNMAFIYAPKHNGREWWESNWWTWLSWTRTRGEAMQKSNPVNEAKKEAW